MINVDEVEAVFLTELAQAGIDPSTQEFLVRGNPIRGVPPGALRKALLSLLRHQQEEIEAIRSLLGKAHASASGPCNEGFRVSVYFHTPEAAQALHAALPLPGEG